MHDTAENDGLCSGLAIIWDFDKTLSPEDSTSKTVSLFPKVDEKEFWANVKKIGRYKNQPTWEHVLASDAPTWMYMLSRIAFKNKKPLNKEFFREFILPEIKLYPNVINFLEKIKNLSNDKRYKNVNLNIYHFIVSAGLKELVEQIFPEDLIHWTFGCRYEVIVPPDKKDTPESIPVFCMDETMKTRSLFEISKGTFEDPENKALNTCIKEEEKFSPFENMIYIGDGDTDIPSLSLVRKHGGKGIAIYNPALPKEKIKTQMKKISEDKRADIITEANFSLDSELFKYIQNQCLQICQRYEAASFCQKNESPGG